MGLMALRWEYGRNDIILSSLSPEDFNFMVNYGRYSSECNQLNVMLTNSKFSGLFLIWKILLILKSW